MVVEMRGSRGNGPGRCVAQDGRPRCMCSAIQYHPTALLKMAMETGVAMEMKLLRRRRVRVRVQRRNQQSGLRR